VAGRTWVPEQGGKNGVVRETQGIAKEQTGGCRQKIEKAQGD